MTTPSTPSTPSTPIAAVRHILKEFPRLRGLVCVMAYRSGRRGLKSAETYFDVADDGAVHRIHRRDAGFERLSALIDIRNVQIGTSNEVGVMLDTLSPAQKEGAAIEAWTKRISERRPD